MLLTYTLFCVLAVANFCYGAAPEIDENGYVLYCPCMGRFGNQADHFLGALSFAHSLNRTLVLPPWVEYDYRKPRSIQIPFDEYFKVEPLTKYHRVMTMEKFMSELAPIIWPPGNRAVYCYSPRQAVVSNSEEKSCHAKDGNPFGSFWDTFDVDFDRSEYYSPLLYDSSSAAEWSQRFPPLEHLVLAFTGAPAAFPVSAKNVGLHQYMEWSNLIDRQAENFIKNNMNGRPFLGIHLRNGVDWTNACKHVSSSQRHHMFASPQCVGYNFEFGEVTEELCFPPEKTVVRQVKNAVKKMSATTVFVATDNDALLKPIEKALDGKVKVVQRLPAEPHVDLAILGKADHYIGNCVSSFSAFAARERRANKKSFEFWAFKSPEKHRSDDL